METNDYLSLIPSWGGGILLGLIFFGGLWWTVQKGMTSPRPATWFLGSMVLRTGVALGGFYLVGSGSFGRIAACLVGFVMARLLVMRLTRSLEIGRSRSEQEALHAPKS